MTFVHRLALILSAVAGLAVACAVVLTACSGGAGSTLSSCASPHDIEPGGVCAMGQSCPSASALPDCPGSEGSLVCTCTKDGWNCVDPAANPCFPEQDGGDGGEGDGEAEDADEDVRDGARDARAG
jgi:hypothetical protein